MKILITGCNGFVGPHLAQYVFDLGHEVYGTTRNRSDKKRVPDFVKTYECELTDSKNTADVIALIKPDIIFHLAAQSFVHTSWKSPADTLNNNIIGELNVLEAVRKYIPDCIVQIAGSSEEYGTPESIPITEDHPLNPLSPYGVSKVAQEKLGFQYHKSYGLSIVLTRAFNHTGLGRDLRFAEASFADQIKKGDIIKVGNLEAIRDYTDVRDMVRAYWLAAMSRCYGVPLNIATGEGHTMAEVISLLSEIANKKVTVEQSSDRMRPSDIFVLIGDSTKFRTLTGWEPLYPFEDTLRELYNE